MKIESILVKHWPRQEPELLGDDIINGETTETLGSYELIDGVLTVFDNEFEPLGRYRVSRKRS